MLGRAPLEVLDGAEKSARTSQENTVATSIKKAVMRICDEEVGRKDKKTVKKGK
jgi:hypothetical protein